MKKFIKLIIAVVLGTVVAAATVICLIVTRKDEASVFGIIGGADGPTQIFVGSPNWQIRLAMQMFAIFAVTMTVVCAIQLIVRYIKNRNKNKP